MAKRFRVLAAIVGFAVVAGILSAQKSQPGDLTSTLDRFQRQLQDLQNQARTLQESLRQISRDARESMRRTAAPKPLVVQSPAAALPPEPQPAENSPQNFQKALDAYRKGTQLEDQKLYRASLEAFSETIRMDPRNDSAYLHRGYGYSQLGDHANAASDFTKSLALQPNNSRAYFARATEYAALGQDPLALADLNEAMLRDPRNPNALVLRGRLYQLGGDEVKASTDYTVALSFDPDSETAYLGRAVSLRSQGLQPLALADCDSAVRVNPNSPAGYLCRAESYNKTGAPDRAIEQLNQAVLAAQTLRQPFTLLADIVQNMSGRRLPTTTTQTQPPHPFPGQQPVPPVQSETSPVTLATAASAPDAPDGQAPQTTIYRPTPLLSAQRPASLTRLIEDAGFYERTGRLRLSQMNFAEAVKAFSQAVQFDPTLATAYNGRGYAYLRLMNYKQAIADFSEAIRLNPAYLNAYENRAATRRVIGEKQAAIDDELKMIDLLRNTKIAGVRTR